MLLPFARNQLRPTGLPQMSPFARIVTCLILLPCLSIALEEDARNTHDLGDVSCAAESDEHMVLLQTGIKPPEQSDALFQKDASRKSLAPAVRVEQVPAYDPKSTCFQSTCGECTPVEASQSFLGISSTYYACYWCQVDNQCWAMGNPTSPCFKASNDQCTSKSSLSACTGKTC